MQYRTLALVLAAATLALAAPAAAQTVNDPSFTVIPVLPNGTLNLPTQIRFIAAGDFLVTEKDTGRVRRVRGNVVSTTVLDLNVATLNERGLLGMDLHPDFPATPFVYLYYSATTGGDGGPWLDNRLSRFTWDGSTLGSELVLMTFGSASDGMAQGPEHDAGPIVFGLDGLLYGTTGDLGGRDNAEQNNQSQASVSSLVGGIYRLNADGSIPPSNPFAANPNSDFHPWYAYGVRNTYGIAIDPLTGSVWDTENGPGDYDEINRISAGTNSGWNEIMGPDVRDPQGVADLVQLPGSSYSDPEFSWLTTVAPTALVFLANSQFDAGYRDAVLVGDNNNGFLYLFRLDVTRTAFALTGGLADLVADDVTERDQVRFGQGFGLVTDLQIGPEGALYLSSFGHGTVYRLPEPSFAILMVAGSLAVAIAGRVRAYSSI